MITNIIWDMTLCKIAASSKFTIKINKDDYESYGTR
jgi:hypothetical protein